MELGIESQIIGILLALRTLTRDSLKVLFIGQYLSQRL